MTRIGTVQRLLSKDAALRLVAEINLGAANVRTLLLQLHDGEGWRALSYKTWEECVKGEFAFGRTYAWRQMEAARIEHRLLPIGNAMAGNHGSHFILLESHARELAAVPEDRQLAVYRRALETSPNGLTAEHIRSTVKAMGFRRRSTIFDDDAAGPTMRRFQSSGIHQSPPEFTSAVEGRFELIELDLAAVKRNRVTARFISPQQDALKQDWTKLLKGKMGYLNPPFDPVGPWSEKAAAEAKKGARFVFLSKASIDADWFWHMFPMAAAFALSPRITFVGERDPFPTPLILSAFNLIDNGVSKREVGRLSRWHWKRENANTTKHKSWRGVSDAEVR